MENSYPLWPVFFTATINNWKPLLRDDHFKKIIISSLQYLTNHKKVRLFAFVIMNNHIHVIWQSLTNQTCKKQQHSFMKYTAQQMKFELIKTNKSFLEEFRVDKKDRTYQFWKRDALSVELFTNKVFMQKLEYIHKNPVKAGLCYYPEDYKYSSASYYYQGIDRFGLLAMDNDSK